MAEAIRVEVVYALPQRQELVQVNLPEGATVRQAIEASGLLQKYPDIVRLGASFRPTKKTEIRLDGEFVRWSVFENQCVVQKGAECRLDANGGQPADGKVVLRDSLAILVYLALVLYQSGARNGCIG